MTADQGAEEHLRAIRQLMERATVYRAISAPTALVGGLLSIGLAVAMLLWQSGGDGERNVDARVFFEAWFFVLLVTLTVNMLFIWKGAMDRGQPVISAGFRLATRSVAPGFFAGVALSGVLTMTTQVALLPTLMWLVCYGLGLLATMTFAPRSIIVLGWSFLFTGVGAFIYFMNQTLLPDMDLPTPTRFYPAAIMGATFGLYHLIYAACTWPRHSHALEEIERRPLLTESHPPLP